RRSHPQGGEAGRSPGAGTDQVRIGYQSEDRESTWPRSTVDTTRPGRRGDRMRRREFISLLGGAAAAWPLAARAQQTAMPVIGFINGGSIESEGRTLFGIWQGLRRARYIENHNVKIEYRWAEGRYDQLPGMAANLVRRQVFVIAATSTPAAVAAKAVTAVVPIVFETGGDPVTLGLVSNWNRPGGNVTRVARLGIELGAKGLGRLHDAIPTAKTIAFLQA